MRIIVVLPAFNCERTLSSTIADIPNDIVDEIILNDRFAPAWKTIEFMTLGNLCSLFNNLKDEQLKISIARHYQCGLGVFINYMETIRVIRNSCAHGSCIYNISLAKAVRRSRHVPITEDTRHNIRGVISVVRYILGIVSVNRQNDMNREISDLLNKPRSQFASQIIQQCTGFNAK